MIGYRKNPGIMESKKQERRGVVMTKFEEEQRRVSSRVIGVVTVGMLPGSRGFKSRDGSIDHTTILEVTREFSTDHTK